MESLKRFDYKYLGMNYSLNSEVGRVRFEYIFRNPQTVWLSFSYYPESRTKYEFDRFDCHIVSPFMIERLNFGQWIKRYSSQVDLSNFLQFDGDFSDQATALIKLLDNALCKSGMDDVLAGRSGIDVPSLSLRV